MGENEGQNQSGAQKAKNSWVWLITTVIIATIVATFTAYRVVKDIIVEVHSTINHPMPRIPEGIAGIEIVTNSTTGSGNLQITCNCPTGKVAIGGGAEILNSGNNSFLTTNKPIISSNNLPIGWEAKEFRITPDFERELKVYAICAPHR